MALAANFLAGTAGSAAEQYISTGQVDARKSITNGLNNAVSNLIYGTDSLGSVKEAFVRGAGAGAATSAINYLSDHVGPKSLNKGASAEFLSGIAGASASPLALMRDPRRGCGSASPFTPSIGYSSAKGYQYNTPQTAARTQSQRKGFSLKEFFGETLLGGLTGGFTSAAFYGAGKGIERLKESAQSRKGALRSETNVVISTSNDDWSFGHLSSESTLNKRQKELLELLSNSGDTVIIRKKSVSMNDLRQLTNVTGDEFDMFTLRGSRLIIRGCGNKVEVSQSMYDDILKGVYGKFSGHTHPGYSLNPGPEDEPFLRALGQYRSSIWGNTGDGWLPFGQDDYETKIVRSEINRKKWAQIFGN